MARLVTVAVLAALLTSCTYKKKVALARDGQAGGADGARDERAESKVDAADVDQADEGGMRVDWGAEVVDLPDAPSDADAVPGDVPLDGPSCLAGVVIAEVQTRGSGGNDDEFVELFNGTGATVLLAGWTLEVRGSGHAAYGVRWTGALGTRIAPFGRFLLVGTGYDVPVVGDAIASEPISSDAASVVLKDANGKMVDVVGFYFNNSTQAEVTTANGYALEGSAVSNLPHKDGNTSASNVDVSLTRKGAGGSACQDTDDNSADFSGNVSATPRNSFSPPTPP